MTLTKKVFLESKKRRKKKCEAKSWNESRYEKSSSFIDKLRFMSSRYSTIIQLTDSGFKIVSFNDFLNIPEYCFKFTSWPSFRRHLINHGFTYTKNKNNSKGDFYIEATHSVFNKSHEIDKIKFRISEEKSQEVTEKFKNIKKRGKPWTLSPYTRGFIFKLEEITQKYPQIMTLTECGFLISDFDEFIKQSSTYFKSTQFETFRKQLFNYGFKTTSFIRDNKRIIRANHEKFNKNQLLPEQILSYRLKPGNKTHYHYF